MKKFEAVSLVLSVVITCLFGPRSAFASHIVMTHDDVVGPTVLFTSIAESSRTHDPLPLYGQPAIHDPPGWLDFENWLDFPVSDSFYATSAGGSGPDWTKGTLTLTIAALPGHGIERIRIGEIGHTEAGSHFGSHALAQVWGNVTVEVPNEPPSTERLHYTPFHRSSWLGMAEIDFDECVLTADVTVNTLLLAKSTWHHGLASIRVNDFFIKVDTEPCELHMPEAGTLAMAAVGLAAIAASRVRTRRRAG
jgi:hypothetical protein